MSTNDEKGNKNPKGGGKAPTLTGVEDTLPPGAHQISETDDATVSHSKQSNDRKGKSMKQNPEVHSQVDEPHPHLVHLGECKIGRGKNKHTRKAADPQPEYNPEVQEPQLPWHEGIRIDEECGGKKNDSKERTSAPTDSNENIEASGPSNAPQHTRTHTRTSEQMGPTEEFLALEDFEDSEGSGRIGDDDTTNVSVAVIPTAYLVGEPDVPSEPQTQPQERKDLCSMSLPCCICHVPIFSCSKKALFLFATIVLVLAALFGGLRGGGKSSATDNNNSVLNTFKEIMDCSWDSFVSNTRMSEDHLGFSVALSGDTAVIGKPGDDNIGENYGSAYVLSRGATWTQEAKLMSSDAATKDAFGNSVAIDADTIVVAAYLDDDHGQYSGSAYIFVRTGSGTETTWEQQTKLVPSDGEANDFFGTSVAIHRDTVVIGAPGTPVDRPSYGGRGIRSGLAYVFTRSGTTWTEQTKLVAKDGSAGNLFGFSVALDKDTIVVGAPQDDDNGYVSGSAYVFTRLNDKNGNDSKSDLWSQQAKLKADDGADFDHFGWSVDISGNVILVGAYMDYDESERSGSAYLFGRSGQTWNEHSKLLPQDGVYQGQFGSNVAIDGGTAVVGAMADDDNGSSSGSAYVFSKIGKTWQQQLKLVPKDGDENDNFGYSIAVDGSNVVVGAPTADNNGNNNTGIVYFVDLCSSSGGE